MTVKEVSTEPAQTLEMVYSIEVVKGAPHERKSQATPLRSREPSDVCL